MISSTAFHIFGGFLGIIYFHFSEIFFLKKRGIFKRIVFFFFFVYNGFRRMAKNSPNKNLKLLEIKTMKIKIISLFHNSCGLFAP